MQQVLHPGLKLEYFRQHQWEKEWIEQAKKMVREEYAANYEKAAESEETSKTSPVQVCGMTLCAISYSFGLIQGSESVSIFANISCHRRVRGNCRLLVS
jgi:hypothetical protein